MNEKSDLETLLTKRDVDTLTQAWAKDPMDAAASLLEWHQLQQTHNPKLYHLMSADVIFLAKHVAYMNDDPVMMEILGALEILQAISSLSAKHETRH